MAFFVRDGFLSEPQIDDIISGGILIRTSVTNQKCTLPASEFSKDLFREYFTQLIVALHCPSAHMWR